MSPRVTKCVGHGGTPQRVGEAFGRGGTVRTAMVAAAGSAVADIGTGGGPQENGTHKHMHRIRRRKSIEPVRQTCATQQRNFEAFRHEWARLHDEQYCASHHHSGARSTFGSRVKEASVGHHTRGLSV